MGAAIELRRLSAHWRHLPLVHVVSTAADLPVVAPSDAAGLFYGGEIYLVDDAPASVPRVIAHEAWHWGSRAVLGRQRWPDFMSAVSAAARRGDPVLQLLRAEVRSIYVDERGANYLTPTLEADELSAALAAHLVDPATGAFVVAQPWRARLALHAGQFARQRLYADVPACNRQVHGLLLAIEHRLKHGGRCWGLGYRLRQWYRASYMPKYDPHAPPMTLAESEALLKASRDAEDTKTGWRVFGFALGIAACVAFFLYALFDTLVRFFH